MMSTPATTRARAVALALILGCQLMMVLDTSIITTAHATFTGAAVVAMFLGTRSTARHSAAVSPSTSTAR